MKCTDCSFNFHQTCTNVKSKYCGLNFLASYIDIQDCDDYVELSEGLKRKKEEKSVKENEDWFC